ncbi:MAG TPA: hypothetical protein VFK02_19105 [Kofleriaceae bacterium]|nr:hypothetical protein [Kofleriaceae bacterium]
MCFGNSRNRIKSLGMSAVSIYRRLPRGRPLIGFQMETPGEVDLRESPDGQIVACREVRHDGKLVGELEASVFAAALIIDRDGILEEKACEAIRRACGGRGSVSAVAVRLPGASGYRSDAVVNAPLPYVYAFAVTAHHLGLDGGVLITVRSASPDWPAGDHMLRTLRILTRHGTAQPTDEASEEREPILPVVAPTRD